MARNGRTTVVQAAHILALCASGSGETLSECAAAADLRYYPEALLLARRTLVASLGCGNWREVRAEAEARLRA